ncbi:hypothetical protein EYV94_13660 [Puteibacter caeruleilacunae]|nr:hypothetical protein EYV94_13660 [Puteibacter caeruleilacunae]
MYKRDFILRMIEMMAELIAGILGLIKKGDYKQASLAIDKAYEDFLQKDAAFFNEIPIEDLTTELLKKHDYTNGHLEILSELFFAQGELASANGQSSDGLPYYEKSLILMEFCLGESKTFSFEKQQRLMALTEKIDKLKYN